MRVLVLTNMYPPHHYGGYELSCQDVVRRWRAAGDDVMVLTSTVQVADVRVPDEDGVRRELQLYWHEHVLERPRWRERLRRERANQAALASALADHRPDVVSVWAMGAMSMSLLATLVASGRPLVYVVCDEWLLYGPHVDPWMAAFGTRQGRAVAPLAARATGVPTQLPDLGSSGAFCFVSEFIRSHAERTSRWRYPRSTVTYSGVELDDLPVVDRENPEWSWRLLHVGRLERRKGIAVAVRALAELPHQATLDVVGRGDETVRGELEALAAELGVADRVRFSSVEREELAGIYAAADAVVFPTLWDEPFGLVPLEAMACGTPVVATGTGGSGEFLAHERNALLVAKDDATALANAVRRLAADAKLRRALVIAGRETARLLTTVRYAEVLREWHLAAVAGFATGEPDARPRPVPEPVR
jgi:glycosyltransferase involved in cell wall biosynthesis